MGGWVGSINKYREKSELKQNANKKKTPGNYERQKVEFEKATTIEQESSSAGRKSRGGDPIPSWP